jgi:hypothetical protein
MINNNFLKNLNNEYIFLLAIYYIYLTYILFTSAFADIEINRIVRFLLILAMLPLFFVINHNSGYNYFYKIFIFLAIIKSFTLILLFTAIVFFKVPVFAVEKIFDIDHGLIFYDKSILHITVKGTAFLLVAFMLRFVRIMKIDLCNIVLFIGVLIAGNFAYLLGLFCFVFYCFFIKFFSHNKYWYIHIALLIVLLLLVFITIMPYVHYQYEAKKSRSNAIRIDQARALLTTGNTITGNGFGSNVRVITRFRTYTDDLYFELQTLYIINQIGIVGYLFFMFCTIYIFYRQNRRMLPVYLLYLLYSFWNPYCFDTTHMIAAFLLIGNKKFAVM